MSTLIKNGIVGLQTTIALDNNVAAASKVQPPAGLMEKKDRLHNEDDIALLKKNAKEQGYAEGKKTAEEELKKLASELQAKHEKLNESLQKNYKLMESELLNVATSLQKNNEDLTKIFESKVLVLTLTCLYKLAGNKNIYNDIVEESIRHSLSQGVYDEKIYIRLPESSASQLGFLTEKLKDTCVVVFESGLESGKCLITSGYTTEDASLQTQLEQIKDQFLATFNAQKSNA